MSSLSFTLTRVWGIPIKLHVTLILLLPLFSHRFGLTIEAAIICAGVMASIVLHELGHSLVAIRKGCRVREILLTPIGGVAQMERIPSRPRDEFLMAIAGPLVSLALFFMLDFAGDHMRPTFILQGVPFNVLTFLGMVNLGLVLFNMIPAFPMDGGRIFRALLASRVGRLKATLVASRLGRVFAVLFGILGLYWMLESGQGLVLIFIAFFIFMAAGSEYRSVRAQEELQQAVYSSWHREPPPRRAAGDDDVVISPPPFREGPDSRSDIERM